MLGRSFKEVKYFIHETRHIRVTIIKTIEKYYLQDNILSRGNDEGYSPYTHHKALVRALSEVQG